MPKVVIVSPNPTNGSGGVERVCHLLAQVLKDGGWQTEIVGPRRWPTSWEFRIGLAGIVVSRSALRAACELDPDLIITSGYLGAGGTLDVPSIHLYHGTLIGGTAAVAGLIPAREVIRRMLSGAIAEALAGRRATRVFCVSQATAREVRRFYRLSRTEVLANGIDDALFAPRDRGQARAKLGLDPDGRYALFVGRFDPGKGGSIALSAAQAAGYALLVAGPTAPAGAHHLGILAPPRLVDAYAATDCVLLPSRYEACSLVALETIASGRPLITTRVGWMRTLLDAVPAYDGMCADATVESVRARLEALKSMDAERITEEARAFVLAHNGLAHWGQQWREIAARTVNAPVRDGVAPAHALTP